MTPTPTEHPVQGEVSDERRIVTLLQSDLPKLIASGILSNTTTFTLRVDGPFGAKEAANLLRLIKAQLEVMEQP